MRTAYIAGKLNDDACDYITNLHKMLRRAEKIRKHGYAIYVPGLDFLMGLFCGNYNYQDYFNNNQEFLKRCDKMIVTEGWETSKGTTKEIKLARELNIPLYTYFEETDEIVLGVHESGKHIRIDIE